MSMRVGIVGLLHESNTFSSQPTTLRAFEEDLLLEGEAIRARFAGAHHEIGGFIDGLESHQESGVTAVPIFVARAIPAGTIPALDFSQLVERLLHDVASAGPLDGILVAPHGATVSEVHRDADGYWLGQLRLMLGEDVPIMGTLDAHANLSVAMVENCHALFAYRTNPHLDQRQCGLQAADTMVRTLRGEILPRMCAVLPPMAINIDRQCTSEPPLNQLMGIADGQLTERSLLSNSVLLGFPYADVAEMGAAAIAIADRDWPVAEQAAIEIAEQLWELRSQVQLQSLDVSAALDEAAACPDRVCLLDMGDNVGGGSAADGTTLLSALQARDLGPSFLCLYDPAAVEICQQAGVGATLRTKVGGKSDTLHGAPVNVTLRVISLHEGRFDEPQPRHGGFQKFDQGPTVVVETDPQITVMLTSRRMVPFSLEQLRSCGLDPQEFCVLVAKGVNAPIAAYQEVCPRMIRVNTPGSTSADVLRLGYSYRRRPLYPWERDLVWAASGPQVLRGRDLRPNTSI